MPLLNDHRSTRKRGFTLTEIVVTMAIIGILGGLTAYAFGSMRGRRSAHDAARAIVGEIHKARMRVLSGRLGDGTLAGPGVPGGGSTIFNASLSGTTESYQHSGVRIENDQTLIFFGDIDTVWDGDEYRLSVLDLGDEYPDGDVRVTAPPVGAEIRFRRNSTRLTGSPGTIVVTDRETGLSTTITVSIAGVPRIL